MSKDLVPDLPISEGLMRELNPLIERLLDLANSDTIAIDRAIPLLAASIGQLAHETVAAVNALEAQQTT